MLQGMKDNIMDNAGQIFKQLTGGDYKGSSHRSLC